ncbi:hypothetical protein BGZ76_000426 [Entomortierella beljakovae]|nr:hypothetical protein BGZ76_000426 [Entomortierella beljakovae]
MDKQSFKRCISFPYPPLDIHPASFPPCGESIKNKNIFTCSIFDIPHILDSICWFLASKDIWNCYRVNTSWHEKFSIYRYQNVRFAETTPFESWDIIENSRYIKSLTIDISDGSHFLSSPKSLLEPYALRPKPQCIKLRELIYADHRYQCRCSYSKRHWFFCSPQDPPNTSAFRLIGQNPLLQSLEVDANWIDRAPDIFDDQFLVPLSNLCFLTNLKISVNQGISLLKVLDNLPLSVKVLELELFFNFNDFDQNSHSFIENKVVKEKNVQELRLQCPCPRIATYVLSSFPRLEDITFSTDDSSDSIISHEVITSLTTCCPRLHSIRINGSVIAAIDLVESYTNGLRVLQAKLIVVPTLNTFVLKSIITHSSNTLQTLRLDCCLRGLSAEIGKVLRLCPNLEVLDLGPSRQKKPKGVALRDILFGQDCKEYPSKYDPIKKEQIIPRRLQWACRNLKELRLLISDTSGPCWSKSFKEKQIWTACQIEQLYQELESLERLSTLNLQWKCQDNDLGDKLVYETALSIMDRYGQPKERKISRQDLLWMGIQWPTQQEFNNQDKQYELIDIAEDEFMKHESVPCLEDWIEEYIHYPSREGFFTELDYFSRDDIYDFNFLVNTKRQFKTGKQYERRSFSGRWFCWPKVPSAIKSTTRLKRYRTHNHYHPKSNRL